MTSMLPFLLELFLTFLSLQMTIATARSNVLHPNCPEYCSNVSIPYPFGIGEGCYRDERFSITCGAVEMEGSGIGPIYGQNLQMSSFSVRRSEATMLKYLGFDCYNESGLTPRNNANLRLGSGVFAISATRNKFTAIGCNTIAYIQGGSTYETGCMSFCKEIPENNDSNGLCTGTGCCQTSLPENFRRYTSGFFPRGTNSTTWEFNRCSYSFVADQDWFVFNTAYLEELNFWNKFKYGVPLVLDWVVDNVTCTEAKKNHTSYACLSNNSYCLDSTNGLRGYTCKCSRGYEGNPYLENGCEDIDECSNKPCPKGNTCKNTAGDYTCSCPEGYHSPDPMQKECDPTPLKSLPLLIKLALGIGSGIVLLLVFSFCTYVESEKRKLSKEKEMFFQKNGGLLLYEEIRSKDSRCGGSFRIFGKEAMEKATNKFDNSLVLGRGGHGTVYRGILEENITVAIKKARMIDECQKEEFVKEILIVSQINHKNVVKLLGCCLEVEVVRVHAFTVHA